MLNGGTLSDFFAAFCHQMASRSLGVGEGVMPLCARCAGLYDGILVAGLWYGVQRRLGWKPRLSGATLSVVATVAALCVVDGATGASHAMNTTNFVRFVLGLGAGLAIGVALLHHFTRAWTERRMSYWIPSSEALLTVLVLAPLLVAGAASVVGLAALGVAAALGLALLHGAAFVTALVVAQRTWVDPGWLKRTLHGHGYAAAALAATLAFPARVFPQEAEPSPPQTVEECIRQKGESARAALKSALDSGSSLFVLATMNGLATDAQLRDGDCSPWRLETRAEEPAPPSPPPPPSPTHVATPPLQGWARVEHACVLRLGREALADLEAFRTRYESWGSYGETARNACVLSMAREVSGSIVARDSRGRAWFVDRTPQVQECVRREVEQAGEADPFEYAARRFGPAASPPPGARAQSASTRGPMTPQETLARIVELAENACALSGGSAFEDWRPPRNPLLHPYLPPVFIVLVIGGAFWFRKKRLESWNEEKEKLRSALLTELRLPKTGDAAARKSVLALLTATKDAPGGEELWLALLSDRIVAIHKDGRRTTVPVKNLRKLDLVEFSGADFGIAIDTTGGKTDIDGRLRLAGAADMVRIVNILIRQGVSVAYRKA